MVKNTSLVFKKVPEGERDPLFCRSSHTPKAERHSCTLTESPKMGEHLAYESQELDLDASLNEGSVRVKVACRWLRAHVWPALIYAIVAMSSSRSFTLVWTLTLSLIHI